MKRVSVAALMAGVAMMGSRFGFGNKVEIVNRPRDDNDFSGSVRSPSPIKYQRARHSGTPGLSFVLPWHRKDADEFNDRAAIALNKVKEFHGHRPDQLNRIKKRKRKCRKYPPPRYAKHRRIMLGEFGVNVCDGDYETVDGKKWTYARLRVKPAGRLAVNKR